MQSKNRGDKPSLDYLFRPRSIAVVGISTDMSKFSTGRLFLESVVDAGFEGPVYPVGRGEGEVFGLSLYHTINDIPGTVDHVISAIPAEHVPQLILDCASKGVKTLHLFTAGFGEIEDQQGEQLQAQVTAMARQKGIRIIGPNCMGLYCPKTKIAFHPDFPKENGTVGFLSQSGGNAIYAVREAATRGVYFSKVVSYGNAIDLNECDFLEYFTYDADTKVIAAYIEGINDGTRFTKALKQAAQVKPVIIYKGGLTESGTRAAASHTGAMAGSDRVWYSLLKQAGAIQVDSMEELLDMLLLFRYMPPPREKNTAVIGIGGGNSVQAADACSSAGLTVPLLPAQTRRRLKDLYTSETGASFRNPVDMYFGRWDLAPKTIKLIAECEQIDLLIIQIVLGWNPRYEKGLIEPYIGLFLSLAKELPKPAAIVLQPFALARRAQTTSEAEAAFYKVGFPVFSSVGQAAKAIVKYIEYHHR